MRTLHPYEDTRRWHDWAEEYYEELQEERERRRLKADAEACGVVWQPEGGEDGFSSDGSDVW